MSTTVFDTLAASKELQGAGLKPEHAEAIAKVIRNGQGELATKSDLNIVRTDLDAVRTDLKNDINWLKWVIGFHVAITLAGFSIVVALLR